MGLIKNVLPNNFNILKGMFIVKRYLDLFNK